MMPDESAADRQYYAGQFARLNQRLDEIKEDLSEWRVDCTRRHAHDPDVLSLMQGNGHPPLPVRLDRLEQAEPRKEKQSTKVMAIVALIVSGLLVVVDAIAALWRK
jgi:hypothetical protein